MKMLNALAALLVGATIVQAEEARDFRPLLEPAQLSDLVADGTVTIIDIRASEAYAAGHIEGALNAPYPLWRGPASNPGEPMSDAALTALLRSLGLVPESRVIVVSAGDSPTDFGASARVYWTLKSAGLTELAVLNGGVASWVGAGQPLSTDVTTAVPSDASFALSDEWLATTEEVAAISSGASAGRLVDARPTEFYQGQRSHPAASTPGTIPGAVNLSNFGFFNGADPRLGTAESLISLAKDAGYVDQGPVVSFCNTGHWAATNWFMMSEVAGIEGVKLYPGSMVEWTSGERPVAIGQ